ncbi:hypothetical protein B0H12DRAFT_1010765 [Mycena haematopus]|nr:hypothetical protein B0H12DRAFT_1010765 [Mycena haematopus]
MVPLTIPVIPPLGHTPGSDSAPATPITPPSATSTSSQVRLRAPARSKQQKVHDVLDSYGFVGFGDFLEAFFEHPGDVDLRTSSHRGAVTSFLQGHSKVRLEKILDLIYTHPQSRPKRKFADQVNAAFSHDKPLSEIRFARPFLTAWSTRIVGDEIYRRVGLLAKKSDDPNSRTHIRATTNGRKAGARVATWEDTEFTIDGLAAQYRNADPFIWYITECFCAPRIKGKVVIRKRRPHPAIQVAALSSFVISRNSYASGNLALPLGIWQFACLTHVDVKRVYTRFGSTVSDSTVRKALSSMSAADMSALKLSVQDATARGESAWGKIFDNVQYYSAVFEHGLGRENELKIGTACTAFKFSGYQPGAFAANDYIAHVIQQDRQTMTTESVFQSIDWAHIAEVSKLHSVRVLAEFTPFLHHLNPQISARFRESPIAKHRIPVCKTVLQPLATNAEQEGTSQGMQRTLREFEEQMGIEPEKYDNILIWNRGDGASHSTVMGLRKYLAVSADIYKSFRNVISTPETWHTKACASNHYGPSASKDPSSLSRSSNTANMKRPTDLKKCDFYPTSRSMTLIWEAHILNCWRLILGIDTDIQSHFEALAASDALPTLEDLLEHAETLCNRYASQNAYDQALSAEEYDQAIPEMKAPKGTPWTAPSAPTIPPTTPKDEPHIHTEDTEFDGDRVLSNSILFVLEFGWWIELNYAIPEGDIRRVMEILKIFIFTFAGTSNQNYMRYMLDLYALLEFECSPALKLTLLNNWLLNLCGEIGKFVEGDLMQEWNNKWLQVMVPRRGAEFDDKYYREIVAPNVLHFIKLKEDIESAFELKRRSKAHTSPHLRDETKVLLTLYKEEQLHLFRSGRSMGHAAVNRFDRGYSRLVAGKMDEFLQRSAEYADVLKSVETLRSLDHPSSMDVDQPSPLASRASSPLDSGRPDSVNSVTGSMRSNSSSTSFNSSKSTASRAAADCVEEWDTVDHSDEGLSSGSDLTVTIDTETGRMSADWYDDEEFEDLLVRLCGAEEEIETEDEDELDPGDNVATDSDESENGH